MFLRFHSNKVALLIKALLLIIIICSYVIPTEAEAADRSGCGGDKQRCCKTGPLCNDKDAWASNCWYNPPACESEKASEDTYRGDVCRCFNENPSFLNTSGRKTTVERLCNSKSDNECKQCIYSEGFYTAIGCIPYDIEKIFNIFFTFSIGVAGMLALLCIISSAIKIQVSGAKSDANAVGEARQKMMHCILGLIMLIFSVFIVSILGSGILGFDIRSSLKPAPIEDPGFSPPPEFDDLTPFISDAPIRRTSPTQEPTTSPTEKPAPPGGSLSAEDLNNGLVFYQKLKDICPDGITLSNYEKCVADMDTSGIKNAEIAKNLLISEMKNMKLRHLQCGSFAKVIYAVYTGEIYKTSYDGTDEETRRCAAYLSEPFWRFKYFNVGEATPEPGDLVKWTNGICGHIAIVVEKISDDKFDVIEANWNWSGRVGRRGVTINDPGIKGFYRL